MTIKCLQPLPNVPRLLLVEIHCSKCMVNALCAGLPEGTGMAWWQGCPGRNNPSSQVNSEDMFQQVYCHKERTKVPTEHLKGNQWPGQNRGFLNLGIPGGDLQTRVPEKVAYMKGARKTERG